MLTRRTLIALASAAVGTALTGCQDNAKASTASTASLLLSSATGADSTGGTDSSSAVQRFINAHTGQVITVDGTYRMDQTLTLPSNTSLVGATTSDGFRFTWSDFKHGGHYIGNADPQNGNTNLTLSGLSIYGAGTGLPAGPTAGAGALSFRNGTNLTLKNLTIKNAPSIAIAYQGFSHVRITGNTVDGSGRDGISGWWYTTPLTDVIVSNNRISRMGDDAIAINASAAENPNHTARPSNIQILNNTIVGHTSFHPNLWGRGILVLGAENVMIQGNQISNTAAAGILISNDEQPTSARFTSRNVQVQKNKVASSGRISGLTNQPRAGMYCTASSQLTIDGNTVTDSYEDGIFVASVTNTTISNNTLTHNGTSSTVSVAHSGISANGTSSVRLTGLVVTSNKAQSNASNGIKVWNATAATVKANTCGSNGVHGDSRTPLSAGIWVYDSPKSILLNNSCTQSAVAAGIGRQSWGIIAPSLSAESAAQRATNTSTGAAIGQIYSGIGSQSALDLWNPGT